ncbi:MAG: hypothetical protein WCJ41_16025 [Aestuariivirga sp.]|uniref:hypothetical protein n=1 Tax=Aestuariivirga sp. TaxID=2650926 RepID=UPI003017A97B
MHILTIIKVIHLVALVMGLGGAVLLDITILMRGVIRPVSQFTIHQAEVLSRFVSAGLVLLWASGIGLIWINYMSKQEYLTNQKLWAKIAIVLILTINGIVVHRKIMPFLKASVGRPLFTGITRRNLAFLTFVGSVSFVSWTVPLILGVASELNYVTGMLVILLLYVTAVLGVWCVLYLVMGSIRKIQDAVRRAAALTLQNSDSWEFFDQDRVQGARLRRVNNT